MPVLLQLGNLYRFAHLREITKPAPIGMHPEETRRSGHRPKLRNSFGTARLSVSVIHLVDLDNTGFSIGNNNSGWLLMRPPAPYHSDAERLRRILLFWYGHCATSYGFLVSCPRKQEHNTANFPAPRTI